MTHKEKALTYFKDKFHCSQAVFAAYAEEIGITEEQALKISYCFNSGMRKGDVCGACSGALMVIGAKYGQSDKNDMESRTKANNLTTLFLDRFREENKSYICNDLLGCDITTPEGGKYALENGLYTSLCPKMVESAVKILEDIINLEKPE